MMRDPNLSHEEMLSPGAVATESVAAPIVRAHASSHHSATAPLTLPDLGPARWGMLAFLLSEVALFSTLVVVYVSYIGQDVVGPTPAEALSLPLVIATTICLLSSSATIHVAEHMLRLGDQKRFLKWWGATIALGVIFLLGTIYEWRELMVEHHLTISRNLFGTTYYTLVGFHGFHVSGGIVAMLVIAILSLTRRIHAQDRLGVELVSWYWHFVDAVWVVVFTVVYIFGR
jgi:cytochrome c oxidase subunit 3/cytochrome o ubiquinol oxidase subunit 3